MIANDRDSSPCTRDQMTKKLTTIQVTVWPLTMSKAHTAQSAIDGLEMTCKIYLYLCRFYQIFVENSLTCTIKIIDLTIKGRCTLGLQTNGSGIDQLIRAGDDMFQLLGKYRITQSKTPCYVNKYLIFTKSKSIVFNIHPYNHINYKIITNSILGLEL